jgi:hypothetical protein
MLTRCRCIGRARSATISSVTDQPTKSPAQRRPRGWLLAGLALVGLAAVGDGPRGLVVDGLGWLGVHWLTLGALGVLVAIVVALALPNAARRRDQAARAVKVTQQAERAAAEQAV